MTADTFAALAAARKARVLATRLEMGEYHCLAAPATLRSAGRHIEALAAANAELEAQLAEVRLEWARAYWRLTKNMDMGELSDYDDELASQVRERRTLSEGIVFGGTRASASEKDKTP